MRWDRANGYGAHAEAAVAAPALEWYLAEGATHSGFDLFYLTCVTYDGSGDRLACSGVCSHQFDSCTANQGSTAACVRDWRSRPA
jgi:hypothetical protein